MLSTRTKQISTYGRRGQRIVNISDHKSQSSKQPEPPSESEDDISSSDSPPPRLAKLKKKSTAVVASPSFSPERVRTKAQKLTKPQYKPVVEIPVRKPLSAFSVNVPHSPARRKGRPVKSLVSKQSPYKAHKGLGGLHSTSPVVNMDILVVDDKGNEIHKERRVSRIGAMQPNIGKQARTTISKATSEGPIELSDSEKAPSKPSQKTSKPRKIVESSDEDSDCVIRSQPSFAAAPKPKPKPRPLSITSEPQDDDSDCVIVEERSKPRSQSFKPPSAAKPQSRSSTSTNKPVKLAHPPPAYTLSSLPTRPEPALVVKPPRPLPMQDLLPAKHKLTVTPPRSKPITSRTSRPVLPPAHSSSDVSDIDSDLERDLAALALSPSTLRQVGASLRAMDKREVESQPTWLRPLLEECGQLSVHEFSSFINAFPLDSIVRSTDGARAKFKKVGEASFSEVFGIGGVVLKVIPLRSPIPNYAQTTRKLVEDVDIPQSSDAKDVLKEICATRTMGDLCEGFVKLLRCYVVRGKYPEVLLRLWDEFEAERGSEGVRPDSFTPSQNYAIIVLPNGGPDLESYVFPSSRTTTAKPWAQACSIFWQIVRTLAEAEDMVQFEHRDLHWGQVLVRSVRSGEKTVKGGTKSMDDLAHGVKVTVIDLGLARMDAEDGVRWTPFEEEVFEGEGDYQFDVYRMMRACNKDSWEGFQPLTNAMWLHYLAFQLFQSKHLRPPTSPTAHKSVSPTLFETQAASPFFTERECYNAMMEIEASLRNSLAQYLPSSMSGSGQGQVKRGRGRPRKTVVQAAKVNEVQIRGATDVLSIGIEKGWIA